MKRLRWIMPLLCLTLLITGCRSKNAPTAQAPLMPAPQVVEKTNAKDGATMVWIPAGEFLMGSADTDKDAAADEKPQHKVYLDGYWMYKNDVTEAQYRAFSLATGRQMPRQMDWSTDNHPVILMNWDDAKAYADWAGAALPTEAEWEKAARGTDGRSYPWGNAWDAAKCNNNVAAPLSGNKASPVGSYPADVSPYGCMDMAGNVCQYCADWYGKDYYQHSMSRNPIGPESGIARVVRGGGYNHFVVTNFRSATRCWYSQTEGADFIGFRCVSRSPEP